VKILTPFAENDNKWACFAQQFSLTKKQLNQFQQYEKLLREWNEKINLTAITDTSDIISDHFEDSLMLTKFKNFLKVSSIADIGAGGGFPGIPLKIKFPHLSLILIEVIQKKVKFLHKVIEDLDLDNVEIYDKDWRTFLRKTDCDVDLFLARASLSPDELVRMFKSGCVYRKAELVYWASAQWKSSKTVLPYVVQEKSYNVNDKHRRYIFFKAE